MGGVAFSVFAQDETGEGLDSASSAFMVTAGDIISQIESVNNKIQEFAQQHAVVTGTAERAAKITGINADQLRQLAVDTSDATSSMEEMTALEVQLGKEHVTSIEQMRTLLPLWETFGDAVQMDSAILLREMAPAFKQFNVSIDETPKYMDRLTTIFATTDLSASMFSSQMVRMGPGLAAAGISLEDVTNILTALNDKGVVGKKAITAMNAALKEVTDAGGESGKAMKDLQDKHDGLAEKIGDVKQRWGDLNERADAGLISKKSYTSTIFSLKQELGHYQTQLATVDGKMKDLSATTSKTVDVHGILMKSLGLTDAELATASTRLAGAGGATAAFAETTEHTKTGQQELTAEIAKSTFGLGGFAEALSAPVGAMAGLGHGIMEVAIIAKLFPSVGAAITGGLGGVTESVGAAAAGVGGSIAVGIVGGVAAGIAGVWTLDQLGILDAFDRLGRDIESSPIGGIVMDALKLVLAPLGSLGAAIIDIERGNWGGILEDIQKPWQQWGETLDSVSGAGEDFGRMVSGAGRATGQAAQGAGGVFIQTVQADFSSEARFREWVKRTGGVDVDDSKRKGVPTQSAT
jgi:DNA-binding transcriptional MerR regulator